MSVTTAKERIKRRRRGAPWTTAELKRLGKTPDSVLARRWGRTIKELVAERERRRIRLPTPPRRWTAKEITMLGGITIAKPPGVYDDLRIMCADKEFALAFLRFDRCISRSGRGPRINFSAQPQTAK